MHLMFSTVRIFFASLSAFQQVTSWGRSLSLSLLHEVAYIWVVLRVMRIECPHALLQAPEVDVMRRVRFVKFAEEGALVPHVPAVACVPTVEDTVHLRHAGDDDGGHHGGALG